MKKTFIISIVFLLTFIINGLSIDYPITPEIPVIDSIFGVEIVDNFRWLENGEDPEVIKWSEQQDSLTRSIIDTYPHKKFLIDRFNQLWRYDDESVPQQVIDGERLFFTIKKKDQEKRIYYTKENENADPVELLNPNNWDLTESIYGLSISRDGEYIAYGVTIGGNENPIVKIMKVSTKEILEDTLRGQRQYATSWLPDNSGFYYIANPIEGEVPKGDENYWSTVYFHKLGTPADFDEKIFYHDTIKEYFHSCYITEDSKYLVFYRTKYNQNEIYFKELNSDEQLIPIAEGFDAQYSPLFIEDKILIKTDLNAPNYKVFITDTDNPSRDHWVEFIPENENDKIWYITGINRHIYVAYQHNAYTQIKIYNLDGEYIRDLTFPTIGTGGVSGYWSKPDIWVYFTSFTYPSTTYKYDFDEDSLILYKEFPIDINVENYTSEQIWYKSKDGTPVSMFLIHRKDIEKNRNNPTLLTGYGGFNSSQLPYFSTSNIVWLEAGGMIAIPNLRGGGEYGKTWHEAGMLENKQNVFDDFIAAAEWLIDNNYTNPHKLAISGGSNGGLLVGAVAMQRPELFKVVKCAVPLLDMIRYHLFGYANLWSEEYGNSEDPDQFKYLLEYSPYHNVKSNIDYPAILITAGENDARVDPLHSRKMVAILQNSNPDGEPILLYIKKDSGHGGATTLSMINDQTAEKWAFLMYYLDMEIPD